MRTDAGPAAASVTPPGQPVVGGTGPGRGARAAVSGRPAPGRPEGPPRRGVGCPHRGRLRVRPAPCRVLPQRVGQHSGDDLAVRPARRYRGHRQHGRLLGDDPRGAALDPAAAGGSGQPRLQRGRQHLARRRCPRHGRQLGDALQLGPQYRRLRPLHPGDRDLERLRPAGPARRRPGGPGHGQPARRHPDHRRSRGPGPAGRHGPRARPPAAQPGLRAPRRPGTAAPPGGGQPAGPPYAARRRRRVTGGLP